MSSFEGVIVVGAGPVGFLTALGVARAGIPVMVVEAESGINDSPRAAVYFPNTLRILDGLGVLPDVEEVAYRSTTFSYRLLATQEAVHVDTSSAFPPDSPYRYNAHFGQHILAQIVSRHLLRLSHAQCRWNTRVTGLRQDSSGVVLTVSTP